MNKLIKAASVVIQVNDKVLMVQRNTKSFNKAWAFPGGVLEQNETYEECVVRETFEEVGLKLRYNVNTKERRIDNAPTKNLSLNYISTWITPEGVADKRFSTKFFHCKLESEAILKRIEINKQEISAWALWRPEEALERAKNGEILLYPPQFYILSRPFVSLPWTFLPVLKSVDNENWAALLYGDKDYPSNGIPGVKHRILVRPKPVIRAEKLIIENEHKLNKYREP